MLFIAIESTLCYSRQEINVSLAAGGKPDAARCFAGAFQVDKQVLHGEIRRRLIRPFDHSQPFPFYIVVQPKVLHLFERIKPVEVYVVQSKASVVLVGQNEGWAANGSVDTQAKGNALGKTGLARTEIAL